MGTVETLPVLVHQAYRFEVDRPVHNPVIPSHVGAKRYAWNWALGLIGQQLHNRSIYRVLALRQGATATGADAYAEQATRLPALVEMNDGRRANHEKKVASGERKGDYRPVSESVPWSAEAMRFIWNREKDAVAPWWAENSKECYSSAFEALAQALKNYFDSRSGERKGRQVGWPKYKRRSGRQSVSFTTGTIQVVDRHHVKLPVIGALRVKEPTDKLRNRINSERARVLRAVLSTSAGKSFVSFSVIAERRADSNHLPSGVCGHDAGISVLLTSSDGHVVENTRPVLKERPKINRYQRRMDRQHRAGSPACFDKNGQHIIGHCFWNRRSKRAGDNRVRLVTAHQKAANARRDAAHKASYRAATTYAVNVVEDLNVAGMVRHGRGKRGFNRAAHDATLSEFRRQLEYKSAWYSSKLWLASRWYPSSKTCSKCRTVKSHLPRSTRVFVCDTCGLAIDRDLNASRNLAALAELACVCLLAQLSTGQPVDWSKLSIRPAGWEPDKSTRSSRGCARAGGRKANGGERKTAQARSAGDRSFDREADAATGSISVLMESHPAPRRRWPDALASDRGSWYGWVTSRPRDPETRSHGQRDIR